MINHKIVAETPVPPKVTYELKKAKDFNAKASQTPKSPKGDLGS